MDHPRKITAPICNDNHINPAHEAEIRLHIPDAERAVDIADLFAHLSDSTRVQILCMLSLGEICVCEMADILGISQPAVSHHLRILRQCGFIRFRKQGKRAVYYLDSENSNLIRRLLSAVCDEATESEGRDDGTQA